LVARCKKRVRLDGKFVEKSLEINILLALIVVILFTHSHLFVFTPRTVCIVPLSLFRKIVDKRKISRLGLSAVQDPNSFQGTVSLV
jgi:hypothetical protein